MFGLLPKGFPLAVFDSPRANSGASSPNGFVIKVIEEGANRSEQALPSKSIGAPEIYQQAIPNRPVIETPPIACRLSPDRRAADGRCHGLKPSASE